MDMVVPPHALVEAAGKLRLHAVYYITKQIIPALERVLNLVGADPRAWFTAMSRPHRLLPQKRPPAALPIADPGQLGSSLGTIDQYYLSRHCAVRSSPDRPCSSSTMPVTAVPVRATQCVWQHAFVDSACCRARPGRVPVYLSGRDGCACHRCATR